MVSVPFLRLRDRTARRPAGRLQATAARLAQDLRRARRPAGRSPEHLKAGNARCKLIEALKEARRAALKHTTRHPAAPGLSTARSALE